jgi:hypothetical protein
MGKPSLAHRVNFIFSPIILLILSFPNLFICANQLLVHCQLSILPSALRPCSIVFSWRTILKS